ncbi:hypothetical protein VP01_164g14 [Puccinia sorghi]|uniref:Uncharacterized protein n=1 Tax=Puccinia sorghi TaxID=27349 RepID=A0A0L6VGL3_9BASI|nr:hypothetical protein VP01_164g14 [Puccinia sorghi]
MRNLTFEPHALPTSAYPPSYSPDQSDLYGNRRFTSSDLTQFSIWIGDINFVPSASSPQRGLHKKNEFDVTPQGDIFVHRDATPSDFLSAFKSTAESSASGFQFSVLGVGGVRPLGNQYNPDSLPASLSGLFHDSLSTLGWMMNAASEDLNKRSIGATYLCTKTRKKWKPFITLVSVAIGSSSGVFGACLGAMIFVSIESKPFLLARKWDERFQARLEARDEIEESEGGGKHLSMTKEHTRHPKMLEARSNVKQRNHFCGTKIQCRPLNLSGLFSTNHAETDILCRRGKEGLEVARRRSRSAFNGRTGVLNTQARPAVLLRRLCFFPASIAMVEFQTSSSMFGVGQWRSDSVEWGESKNNMRNECLIFSSVRKCSPPFPVPIFFLSPFKLNMLPSYCSKTQLFCN